MSRRVVAKQSNHDRWLVSYADFITLLFALFVVLFSASRLDHRRVGQLAQAVQAAFKQLGVFPQGATTGAGSLREADAVEDAIEARKKLAAELSAKQAAELDNLEVKIKVVMAREIQSQTVAVGRGAEGVVISLREAGFYDSGSATMRPQAEQAFGKLVSVLGNRSYPLRIEGHTDDVPIHNSHFHSNWELSTTRATEVVRLLITKYEYPPDFLAAAGYAEYHPVADNHSDVGRRANRRVDVVVLTRRDSGWKEDD
jgi:chemotaxis protein MotB